MEELLSFLRPTICIAMNNINFQHIDQQVKEYLTQLTNKMPSLDNKITELEKELEQEITPVKYKILEEQINDIRDMIADISDLIDYYDKYAKPLIDKICGSQRKKIVFGKTKSTSNFTNNQEQSDFVNKYLDIVGQIVDLIVDENNEQIKYCSGCGDEYSRDGSSLKCRVCGLQRDPYTYSVNSDSEESRYRNDENFHTMLLKFQGKGNMRLPDNWYQLLDHYFSNTNFYPPSEIRKQTLNENGTRGNTSRKILKSAMSQVGLNNYAEINYIGHVYWNWKLPDLSSYEARILTDYAQTQANYAQAIKDLNYQMSSSLNVSYRLFKHLQLIGYPCESSEFDISPVVETRQKYESLWARMCKLANKPYIPTVWD